LLPSKTLYIDPHVTYHSLVPTLALFCNRCFHFHLISDAGAQAGRTLKSSEETEYSHQELFNHTTDIYSPLKNYTISLQNYTVEVPEEVVSIYNDTHAYLEELSGHVSSLFNHTYDGEEVTYNHSDVHQALFNHTKPVYHDAESSKEYEHPTFTFTFPTLTAETFSSVAAAVTATPELSTLLAAASAVGLDEVLADESLVATVFAPTDAAFAAFLETYGLTPEELLAETDLVSLVLSYHVVPEVAATADSLSDDQKLSTLNEGQEITVIKFNHIFKNLRVFLDPSDEDAPNARVVGADIQAGESIVHIINQVLVPDNFPLTPLGGDAAAADAAAAATATTPILEVEDGADGFEGQTIVEKVG